MLIEKENDKEQNYYVILYRQHPLSRSKEFDTH